MGSIKLSDEDRARLVSMPDSVVEIVEAALSLEQSYYSGEASLIPLFYNLRN